MDGEKLPGIEICSSLFTMSGSILARSEQRLSWECIQGSWTTRGELSTSRLMSYILSTVCLWLMANNNCIFSPSDVGYAGFLNTNETPDPNTFFRKAKIFKYLYDIWYYHRIFSDNIKLHEPFYPIIIHRKQYILIPPIAYLPISF